MSAKQVTLDSHQMKGEIDDGSRLFKALGRNANSVIVGVLFILTLIVFLIYLCVFKEKISDTITTGFFSLLSMFGGFFVGSLKNSN